MRSKGLEWCGSYSKRCIYTWWVTTRKFDRLNNVQIFPWKITRGTIIWIYTRKEERKDKVKKKGSERIMRGCTVDTEALWIPLRLIGLATPRVKTLSIISPGIPGARVAQSKQRPVLYLCISRHSSLNCFIQVLQSTALVIRSGRPNTRKVG
jgi:hypothetical protein